MISRRRLLDTTWKTSAGLAILPKLSAFAQNSAAVELRLSGPAVPLPANFTGLGYEMSSVAPLGLLSPDNHRYVELVKGLGTSGVIRVGGIVANFMKYEPNGTIKADKTDTVITRTSLEQFGAFLRKIGWTAIWSVNFAQGTIADAVAEARAVHEVLGQSLLALEIGNEVENYRTRHQPFRPATWDYPDYRKEYSEWRAAILKSVPGLSFAAPDTAANYEWVERMAADAHGEVQLLTTHYYRNGQTRGSAEQLQTPDPHLMDALARLRKASQQSGIPWRLCETNSFSGGGRPGVSDTLLGALWTLDFMLLVAANACSGINIETGVNQLGFVSSYSPIQDDGKGVNIAGVPYYGMLAFARAAAGCTQVLPLDLQDGMPSLTAYALGSGGKARSVVAINRETDRGCDVSVAHLKLANVSIMRLVAPDPAKLTSVTLGDSIVQPDGTWAPGAYEMLRGALVPVPAMSAVVLCTHA